jgi:SAM-dependent methyltransferase
MSYEALTESGQDWEEQARDWIAWAREPEFDSYWRYRAEFFDFVPPPGAATLDLGCGEGRVSRDLAARGHRLISVDPSPTLLAAAREAHPEGDYRLADGAALPFPDGAFDLVIAYNVLMDVVDLPGTIHEAGRVLAPGGRLCVSITHPVINTGTLVGDGADARFLFDKPYFGRHKFRTVEQRDGMRMTFVGWNAPLVDYTRPLEDAGLLIEAIREPVARRANGFAFDFPFHMWFRVVKPA